jgi:hypothetical protein
MSIGRIIAIILGVASIVIAIVYVVSPEAIGGPLEPGELAPQAGMPGDAVTLEFTTIPLPGIGSLVVPATSAVLIFGILGVALLIAGLVPGKKGSSENG